MVSDITLELPKDETQVHDKAFFYDSFNQEHQEGNIINIFKDKK